MLNNNPMISVLLDVDSYKFSHWVQYPPNTTGMGSYLESRGGEFPATVFFGLQYYLKRFLSHPVTMEQVEEAALFAKLHGVPFNYDGWKRIALDLGGRLPVRIRAVPEGSVVPTGNVLMTVESTDPASFWIVSWLETILVRLWYSINVATISYYAKNLIRTHLKFTADDAEAEIGFKLHDFGGRGVSSQESAAIGGAAHLVNFQGSDTVVGIALANEYYNHEMAAFSIPASEHSTMTMWGRDREALAYANMLKQYEGQPIFACVSDSYDIFNAASNIWGGELKDKVIEREGVLVVRPDSGDPETVCIDVLNRLAEAFGTTENSKGYKVLNHGVRIIQGDGVNLKSIGEILNALERWGYSATNIAFGMGGALLQKHDRDTLNFGFKCSWATVDGKDIDVFKEPVTSTMKKSKRGKLELELASNGTVRTVRREEAKNTVLRTVYENGEILIEDTLDAIRARANGAPFEVAKWRPAVP